MQALLASIPFVLESDILLLEFFDSFAHLVDFGLERIEHLVAFLQRLLEIFVLASVRSELGT